LADRDGAPALVHRLLTEQAFGQWRRYAVAFALMGVAAAGTALGASPCCLAGCQLNAHREATVVLVAKVEVAVLENHLPVVILQDVCRVIVNLVRLDSLPIAAEFQ